MLNAVNPMFLFDMQVMAVYIGIRLRTLVKDHVEAVSAILAVADTVCFGLMDEAFRDAVR